MRDADLKTSHGGPDLLYVPHGDDIRFKHLRDKTEPVRQFRGRLVEVSGRHGVRRTRPLAVGLLAYQSDRLHSRGDRRY